MASLSSKAPTVPIIIDVGDGLRFEGTLAELVEVSRDHYDNQLDTTLQNIVFFGTMLMKARRKFYNAEGERKRVYAELWVRHKDLDASKPASSDVAERLSLIAPTYRDALAAEQRAQSNYENLQEILRMLRDRQETLMELMRHERATAQSGRVYGDTR